MKALNRKLLRDILHLRGQLLATGIVVACGVASFVSMRSTYDSLSMTQEEYYAEYAFADIFAHLKRAPEAVRPTLERIPGISSVDTRVVADVTLSVAGLAEPASGRIVSVPEDPGQMLNRIHLLRGRTIGPGAQDEVVISGAFAEANKLDPGDTIEAVINSHWRRLRIVGVALSPEYIYEIRSGDVFPDNRRYGILWMGEDNVAAAFDMTSAFNDVAITLAPQASESDVIANVDRVLEIYGGTGAYARSEQQSHRFLSNEFQELEVLGVFLPSIFLAITAFLLHIVLSRLVSTQREQIGLLKAFGYSDASIGWHFLKLGSAAVAGGLIIGVLFGMWLGAAMTDLYAEYFRFPLLEYGVSLPLLVLSGAIAFGTTVIGALSAVSRAVGLPPAEAMLPESPPKFKAGFLEQLGLQRFMKPVHRIMVRSLARHPIKAMFSVVGISLAAALLFTGFYFFDAIDRIIEIQFQQAIRSDVDVVFYQPRAGRVRYELARLPGVTDSQVFRSVPARLRFEHRSKRIGLMGVATDGRLRRIVDKDSHVVHPPIDGLLLSKALADYLKVGAGDEVTVEALEGSRPVRQIEVVGTVDELMGLNAYLELHALNRFMHEDDLISGAYLEVDPLKRDELYSVLRQTPSVAGVGLPSAALESFDETFGRIIGTFTFFLVGFASAIVLGVVYNGVRIALSERSRELASMRVLGFTEREITTILLGEHAILTLAAIPLGFLFGYFVCLASNMIVDRELIRLPLVFSQRTFVVTAVLTIVAAAVSGLLVSWRLRHLDLIEVLKSRE